MINLLRGGGEDIGVMRIKFMNLIYENRDQYLTPDCIKEIEGLIGKQDKFVNYDENIFTIMKDNLMRIGDRTSQEQLENMRLSFMNLIYENHGDYLTPHCLKEIEEQLKIIAQVQVRASGQVSTASIYGAEIDLMNS
jgi:hypothetical protein